MKVNINVPMEVEVSTVSTFDPSNYADEIVAEYKEQIIKSIDKNLTALFSSAGYITNAWGMRRYTILDPKAWVWETRGIMREEVRDFLKDNREELLDRVVKEVSDRVLRSSKNKNEIVEKLLNILAME